jgi:hypothetical protein
MGIVRGLLIGQLLAAGSAHAVDPAADCKADKIRRAGLYDLCLLKAHAKALKKGSALDVSRCDAQFGAGWAKAEAKGAGACPTNGDATTMAAQVNGDVSGVIAALTPTTSTTTTTIAFCGGSSYPACGGTCPSGTSCWATVFLPPSGNCACLPVDATPCEDTGGSISSGPLCGGTCPSGKVCSTLYVDDTTLSFTCGCIPAGSTPCLSVGAPACGGSCPTGTSCGVDPLGLFACRCQ